MAKHLASVRKHPDAVADSRHTLRSSARRDRPRRALDAIGHVEVFDAIRHVEVA
jgi:hypothetical protein